MIRVILAVMIVLGGQYLADQPELYESFFEAIYETPTVADDPVIVPLQSEEKWLVVVIEFPEDPADAASADDTARADSILNGINSVKTYFSDMSGGLTNFSADIHQTVHTAKFAATDYGADSGSNRDEGTPKSGGPSGLVEEAFTTTFATIDISPYDLDGDGWIDRLLILHTGGAQEDNGGTSAIWSHYSPLAFGITVGDTEIGQYCMASFDSGMGTITHEMLHMLGALDLYDVHSDAPSDPWSGLGDWDIMASGNWNGNNGRTPALPTSATLDLIGAVEPLDLHIGEAGPENQSYLIPSHVTNSGIFRIEIAPGEYVWMESRQNSGFDRKIPGHGLLVTQQNLNNGDIESNEVNHNPDFAWIKVIEADGDDGLIRGEDDGASGDVFTGGKFGAEGIEIRDGHGRLVHWTVEVTEFDSAGTDVTISSEGVGAADVMPPPSPIRLLGSESIPIVFTARQNCMPWSQVTSDDNRIISLEGAQQMEAGETRTFPLEWVGESTPGDSGLIEGTIGCGANNPATDIRLSWSIVDNRLIPRQFESEIPVEDQSIVSIPLTFTGDGFSDYEIVIEGPLSRIATIESPQTIGDGSTLEISIDPQGLLSPGMVAEGTVQLHDSNGLAAEFPVTLQAEPPQGAGAAIAWLAEPSNNVQIVSFLMALWVLAGMRKKKPKEKESQIRTPLLERQQFETPLSYQPENEVFNQ